MKRTADARFASLPWRFVLTLELYRTRVLTEV
jgi:hypothetical protein